MSTSTRYAARFEPADEGWEYHTVRLLARRLGIPRTVVDRLFDLQHHSRIEQVEAAFRILGKELSIEVRDAS